LSPEWLPRPALNATSEQARKESGKGVRELHLFILGDLRFTWSLFIFAVFCSLQESLGLINTHGEVWLSIVYNLSRLKYFVITD
jgi:hypothetical protein